MTSEEQTMQRYLLGEMTEAKRSVLEQNYFEDLRVFDRLVEVENNLVDDYARGLLHPRTREQFEKHYLINERRRQRTEFAEALAQKVDQAGEVAVARTIKVESRWRLRWPAFVRGPGLAWAFSVALLLMAALAVWSLLETRRLRGEFVRTEADRSSKERRELELEQQVANEKQRSDQLLAELERLRAEKLPVTPSATPAETPAPLFVSLVLTVGGTRGAETAPPAVLVIPDGTKQVRLQLSLKESNYPNYRAVLQSAGGDQAFSRGRLVPRTTRGVANIMLVLPAEQFSARDYILTLKGVSESGEVEDVSKSLFRVERILNIDR